jgi:hypothetical protein
VPLNIHVGGSVSEANLALVIDRRLDRQDAAAGKVKGFI